MAQSPTIDLPETAELLNVSQSYLIMLLDKGKIPHRMAGTDRRIRLDDAADRTLDDLVAQAQEFKMGY